MNYYKIIQGVKYDLKLLLAAEDIMHNEDAGMLSQVGVEKIFQAALGAGTLSDVERQTLLFIRQQYTLEDSAASWYDRQLMAQVPQSITEQVAGIINKAYGFGRLSVLLDEEEVQQQAALTHNQVSFMDALNRAIHVYLEDQSRESSPYKIVQQVHMTESHEQVQALLREHLEYGDLIHLPLMGAEQAEAAGFALPREGESIADYWAFSLFLPTLSDHVFWALIPRHDTVHAYTYGMN